MSSAVAMLLVLAGSVALAEAAVVRGSVEVRMQPAVVSRLLSEVEHSWEKTALSALAGLKTQAVALQEIQKSCQKVSKSIIAGSEGDKDRVMEYMKEVCDASTAEEKVVCGEFSAHIESAMTHDAYHNREELDLSAFCASFYQDSVMERATKERKLQLETEAAKKKQEEVAAQEAALNEHKAKAAARHSEMVKVEKEVQQSQAALKDADAKAAAIDKAEQDAKALVENAQKELQTADEKEVAAAEATAKKAADEAAEKRRQVAERAAAEKAKLEAKQKADEAKAAQAKATEAKAAAAKVAAEKQAPAEAKPAPATPAAPAEKQTQKLALAARARTRLGHCPPCGSLVCPHGFTAEEAEGHCCPYCVNPAISTEVVKDPAYYAEKAAPIYKKYR